MPVPIGSPAKALKSLVAPARGLVQTARGRRACEPIRCPGRSACGRGKRAFPYLGATAPTDLRAAVLAVSWHGQPAIAGSGGWPRSGRVAGKHPVRARPASSVDAAGNAIHSCSILLSKRRASMAIATRVFLAVLGGLLLSSGAASADKRVALVIGNSSYAHAPALDNPVNDATAVSVMLKSAGFQVVETRNNLDLAAMGRVIRDFAVITYDADVAVVFYAGHGIEVDGVNYLIPTDAKLATDIDVEYEAMPLDRVLRVLEPARSLRLVILDACRDNPFVRTMKRTMSRAVGRGLAGVEPTGSNTLIAFAAKAGSTAQD